MPLVAEVTAASVADLGLAPGASVWSSLKATEIDVYPVRPGGRGVRRQPNCSTRSVAGHDPHGREVAPVLTVAGAVRGPPRPTVGAARPGGRPEPDDSMAEALARAAKIWARVRWYIVSLTSSAAFSMDFSAIRSYSAGVPAIGTGTTSVRPGRRAGTPTALLSARTRRIESDSVLDRRRPPDLSPWSDDPRPVPVDRQGGRRDRWRPRHRGRDRPDLRRRRCRCRHRRPHPLAARGGRRGRPVPRAPGRWSSLRRERGREPRGAGRGHRGGVRRHRHRGQQRRWLDAHRPSSTPACRPSKGRSTSTSRPRSP